MKERNYGIDLLRLVLMYMICVLHVLSQGGILYAFEEGSLRYHFFWVLYILCCCAVNSFGMISGYTASEKKQKYDKLVNMWFQAFFYSFVLTGIFVLTGVKETWDQASVIKAAMPVSYGYFWYFTAYVALYFAMPLLNKALFAMNRDTAQRTLVLLVLLFSVMETIAGPFRTGAGYSTFWLLILYCIGVLAKRIDLFRNTSTVMLLLMLAMSTALTWVMATQFKANKYMDYVSPTMVLNGILMVVLFSRIRFSGKLISKLSPLAFGVYLFQMNEVVWAYYFYRVIPSIRLTNLAKGAFSALGGGMALFLAGLAVELLRSAIAKMLRIPQLSSRIASGFESLLDKLAGILD